MSHLLAYDFQWSFIWDHRDEFVKGLRLTLEVSAIAIAGALLIGVVLGAARAYRIPVVSQLAAAYVEVIRNTPLLVQVFLLFFGLPQFGIRLEPFTGAWVALVIWGGAFNIENFRAGFEAVPVRYREAGLALGFGPIETFLNVVLPIGGRIALPSSINTYVSILKNTAVLGPAIGFNELTNVGYSLQSETFRYLEIYVVLAVVYLVVVWVLSGLIRALEAHLRLPDDRRVRAARRPPVGEAA
jgi:polar amino acid transport system permease protein